MFFSSELFKKNDIVELISAFLSFFVEWGGGIVFMGETLTLWSLTNALVFRETFWHRGIINCPHARDAHPDSSVYARPHHRCSLALRLRLFPVSSSGPEI